VVGPPTTRGAGTARTGQGVVVGHTKLPQYGHSLLEETRAQNAGLYVHKNF